MASPFVHLEQALIGSARVHYGFTGVAAGNLGLHVGHNRQDVLKNRYQLQEFLGLNEDGVLYLNQVHASHVVDADSCSDLSLQPDNLSAETGAQLLEAAPRADAALSVRGRALAVLVADCIPVLLAGLGPQGRPLLAVAHAGRQGLLTGVLEETHARMLERGARQIRAWLGPSICASCYEVPEEMRLQASAELPALYAETSWGSPSLDLPAGAEAILESLPHIESVSRQLASCTYENESFFSHRRGQPVGRFAGLIWVEEAAL